MALIQVEGTGLQAAQCRYCTKSDVVSMWCAEYAKASIVVVSGSRERAVVFLTCGGLVVVSKSI